MCYLTVSKHLQVPGCRCLEWKETPILIRTHLLDSRLHLVYCVSFSFLHQVHGLAAVFNNHGHWFLPVRYRISGAWDEEQWKMGKVSGYTWETGSVGGLSVFPQVSEVTADSKDESRKINRKRRHGHFFKSQQLICFSIFKVYLFFGRVE